MNTKTKLLLTALITSMIAACGGGGGESAFPDDPMFNQTSLNAPTSVYPGLSGPAGFELASVYQGTNLLVGGKNTFYTAGPNDRTFTLSMIFDEADLTTGTFTGSGTSKAINEKIQVTSLNIEGSTRNFCVNIRGDSLAQPRAYAVFGTQVINLATLGSIERFCSDLGVDQSGNRFIATKPIASSLASTPGLLGSPSIYRAPVNSSIFSTYWSGVNKYQAQVDDLNNPGSTITVIRDLMVSGISISGDTLNWTGTYRANDTDDLALGVQDATFFYENSASAIVLPISGTRLAVSNLGEGKLFFAEEIISVGNGSQIYLLADQEEGTQEFSGLVVLERGTPTTIVPVTTGAGCLGTFSIRDLSKKQYTCFKQTDGFLTTLLLN